MTHWTLSPFRTRKNSRRLIVLFLFGWSNLVLQPCSAAMAAPCLNCPGADHRDTCATQVDNGCSVSDAGIGAKAPDAPGKAAASTVLIALTPLPLHAATIRQQQLRIQQLIPPADDPPARIRYCSYLI